TGLSFTDSDLPEDLPAFCYQVIAHRSDSLARSKSIVVCTRQAPKLWIPNAFSPGQADGINDSFGPAGAWIKSYSMRIFNRWGELIYTTESSQPWNGANAPSGVYLYRITVNGFDGEVLREVGTVTVVE
ncbi:MAG: gliding motility-associated C-terminal domain-containing protein, partial [Bacteroidia bacterium]